MTCVLCADDSAHMRLMIAHTLRAAGYEVVIAVDGVDAFEKLAEHHVDVVLTDNNMPRMDGVELTRAIRGDKRYDAIPVLILTTDTDDRAKQSGREAGATGWLAKPFDPVTLVRTIQRVAPKSEEASNDA